MDLALMLSISKEKGKNIKVLAVVFFTFVFSGVIVINYLRLQRRAVSISVYRNNYIHFSGDLTILDKKLHDLMYSCHDRDNSIKIISKIFSHFFSSDKIDVSDDNMSGGGVKFYKVIFHGNGDFFGLVGFLKEIYRLKFYINIDGFRIFKSSDKSHDLLDVVIVIRVYKGECI